jgi:glycine oxidase
LGIGHWELNRIPNVNITVVGAGVVGCAIAHELASRGARVQLIDPRGAGHGATGASAGILAPHIEGHSQALLRLGVCSMGLWDHFIRRVHADSEQAVEYQRGGTLQAALNATQATVLLDVAQRLESAGVAHSVLDGREAVRLEPALTARTRTALLVPSHGYVGPAPLIDGLVRAGARHGVSMVTAHARRIEDDREAVLTTDEGVIRSDAIVVATGSWTRNLLDVSAAHVVKPVRGQLLQLSLEPRTATRVVWGADCYVVPWTDGTVLVGATVEDVGFDESTTAEGVRGLLNSAIELIPALGTARFREARAGLRPKTADELPAIGRSSTMPHVFYAVGHYRNGVLLAPLTAALIADLVLEGRERPELSDVRPDRFGL